ncbi:hypothetical protein ACFYW1_04395 [Streptomyces sp. NPDC002669]|uniref:hypothetical protein n=1 Tax=Streptomyces sp. NPDC002669 TaxID=3364658 RepID=UPI0036920EFB
MPGSALKTYLPANRTLPEEWKVSTVFEEHDSGPKLVPPSANLSPTVNFGCDQLVRSGTEAPLGGWSAYASPGRATDPSAHEVGIMVRVYSTGQASEARPESPPSTSRRRGFSLTLHRHHVDDPRSRQHLNPARATEDINETPEESNPRLTDNPAPHTHLRERRGGSGPALSEDLFHQLALSFW